MRGIFLLKIIANQSTIFLVKTNYASKSTIRSTGKDRLFAAGFSRRLARPSIGQTFASLTSSFRGDGLWDASLLDRLQAPLTRHHD